MIKSFRAVCQWYDIQLEEEKKLKKNDAERGAQVIAAGIETLRTKQKNLAAAIELMDTGCFHCMKLAEKKDGMSFIIKGNRLKRKSEESKRPEKNKLLTYKIR